MKLEYACFILAFYVILVLAGIWLHGYWEKKRGMRKPVQLPLLSGQEKRQKLNELIAPFGFAYDGKQDIFYSRMDSWQRKYGYGRIYDEAAAPFNMVIDCEPIYFEYDGKHWMIEFWKGQYGITTGGEVGIYYLPQKSLGEELLGPEVFYRCVEEEDTLRMKTVLYKKGKQLYFRRGYHWWLTGFVLGEFSKPKELEMDIEITLRDDQMRDAFLKGLYRAGYQREELNVRGTTVWIHFTRPHTKQPLTRNRLFVSVKQWENKRNCRLYGRITKDYADAYDKLLALQAKAPILYGKLGHLLRSRFAAGEGQDGQI